MTFPITPNPGIHQEPKGVGAQRMLLSVQQLAIWAEQLPLAMMKELVTAILNALNAAIPLPLQGPISNIEGALGEVTGAVETALGSLSSAALGAVAEIETLITEVGAATITDVAALINAIEQFVAQWTAALAVTGVSTPTNFVELLRGLIPAAIPQFNGTAIATTVDGFVDNLNGTISYTIQEGQNEVSHLIQQADGTVVTAAVLAQHIASAATTAGVSAGQAVASGMAGAANAQGVINGIHNVVNNTVALVDQDVATVEAGLAGFFGGLHAGFTGGNIVTPPPASAADISAAAAALQQRLATIGNGGEELVDILFSSYTNGSLPAAWTVVGANGFSITGGLFTWNNAGSGTAYYSGASTLTDYQSISATFQSVSGSQPSIIGRGSPSLPGPTFMKYLGGTWALFGAGISLATYTDTFTPGIYAFVCGDPVTSNPRHFQFLKNGIPLTVASVSSGSGVGTTTWSDDSAVTNLGGGYRTPGLGSSAGGSFTVSEFSFQDTTQSSPAVLVTTSESTASTTYTDLTTTSDDVAVVIGSRGLAQVNISAQLSNNVATGDSLVSFALSGANTQAASNTFAISIPCTTSHFTQPGASFLLTGLAPGLTVFKMKYAAQSGTTATFANRQISVVAL